MHDRGWNLKFDANTYPVEIQPIGFGREDSRRPRGYFESLLRAYIWISPPNAWVAHQLPSVANEDYKNDSLKVPEQPSLTGSQIKKLRLERGWSQRKLAKMTCISQGLISMIENGTRAITVENEQIFRRVFDYL